ncbi:unnamed protein product [Lactuca saligna]|uniref:Uncharacterized protein n=1 Tax=Lactuca saligna TaxID=75948 RepID=A0AA35YJY0_LACSI|nr:unnamed protein product [Lactuca saligna]
MDNWFPSQQTQIDDENVLVDNTQIDNKDGKGQTTNKKKKYAKRAACWADYDELEVNNVQHSKCKWCDTLLKTESGENENEAFIEYTNALNGKVVLPSRTTVSKRVANYYVEEKEKLNKFFSNPLMNVHLTTDCWTSSCQRSSFMVVTAHFIDKDWIMHKRVINFKSLDSHRGEDIGHTLLTCLEEWGINNVMTIIVDNATSNDKAIEFLMKKLPNLYDGGETITRKKKISKFVELWLDFSRNSRNMCCVQAHERLGVNSPILLEQEGYD